MADDVRLTDLELIQRYSIAVRGETADRAELIATLRADLAWLQGTGASKSSAAKSSAAKSSAAKSSAAKPSAAKRSAAKPVKRAPAKSARRGR